MTFVRSRLSIGNFIGQRCRRITETWGHRKMCSKPQEVKVEPRSASPAQAAQATFKVPGHRPSGLDKKVLVWSGRFKTTDKIPELVSTDIITAARNKVRVQACYIMMAFTVGSCIVMAFLGKKALIKNKTLITHNMEKKARWREELQEDRDAVVTLSEK